ncbi:hypothetical protein DL771_002495 [Monosporascus sp. 5C6A]|nr:hypothetical protein DL771_002495 [Monosporascus sp. 5C6A]
MAVLTLRSSITEFSTNGNGKSNGTAREHWDETSSSTPIAVIGLSGKFPGEATDPQKFWKLLTEARSGRVEVPESRFNAAGFYHPDGSRAGSMNTTSREGYFLTEGVDRFDARFFSITPEEAKAMDPTQRILLELAYESIENAGLKLDEVAGQRMSCFIGACQHDYWDLQAYDMDASPKYTATGAGTALLANRISWFFDLKGPSVTVDTACSSSMSALHLACESIRHGGCDSALVGGLGLMLLPNYGIFMTSMSFMSPDDKCHSFDERANGYARGEGGGFVVLKRLDDAIKDGDTIRAVIRATGANQDGRTLGITRPSSQRQEELIRSTYASAGLSYNDTNYFEAHGTGTKAGDPAECSVIGSVFGPSREHPILVGSVKSNVGHLEGSSAISSLIKVIYSLESGLIPPTIGVERVNPRIRLDDWKIEIPTKTVHWPPGIRRASINSFGYGGANAHCILDDAYHFLQTHGLKGLHNTKIWGSCTEQLSNSPDRGMSESQPRSSNRLEAATMADSDSRRFSTNGGTISDQGNRARLFALSSHEESGIARLCQSLRSHLDEVSVEGNAEEDAYLQRLAYTLTEKRSSLPWKSCFVANNMSDLRQALGRSSSGKVTTTRPLKPPHITFVFTGQGAQWPAMGRGLLRYPAFRRSLEASAACLKSLGCAWNLLDELYNEAETSKIDNPDVSQPACTALQIGILDLLATWDVRPKTVIGHSSGEIAAAYAKQVLHRDAAMRISYFRGLLTSKISREGSMAVVGLGVQAVNDYIAKVSRGVVVVACINSPSSVTVSGDVGGIDELLEFFKADDLFARRLRVSTAYHSHHMNLVSEAYLGSMAGQFEVSSGRKDISMFSSVTADLINGQELGPSYWVTNLVSAVDFSGAVDAALRSTGGRSGHRRKEEHVILEVGPHSALQGPLKQILAAQGERSPNKPCYLAVLKRGHDAVRTCLEAVGEAFLYGQPIDFSLPNAYESGSEVISPLVDLPHYAWNRSHSYWAESAATRAYRRRNHPRLELLGARDERSTELEPCWRNYLRVTEQPWIQHHQFQGTNIYPMAGMIVMAIEATRQQMEKQRRRREDDDENDDVLVVEGYHVRDVHVLSALVVPYDESIETRLQLSAWRSGPNNHDNNNSNNNSTNSDNGGTKSHWTEFKISSRAESGAWTSNCTGLIAVEVREKRPSTTFCSEEDANNARLATKYEELLHADMPTLDSTVFYTDLENSGFFLGPCFRGVKELNVLESKSRFSMEVANTLDWTTSHFQPPHLIHPAVLDVFVHLLLSSTGGSDGKNDKVEARIPVSCESLYVSAGFDSSSGTTYSGFCSSQKLGGRSTDVMTSDVVAFGGGGSSSDKRRGKPMIILRGCRTVPLSRGTADVEQSLDHVPCVPVLQPDVEMAEGPQLEALLRSLVQARMGHHSKSTGDRPWTARGDGKSSLENIQMPGSTAALNGNLDASQTDKDTAVASKQNGITQVNGNKPESDNVCPESVVAIGYYVALLAHKHTALDILEYKPSAESVMTSILSLSLGLEDDDMASKRVRSGILIDCDPLEAINDGNGLPAAGASEEATMIQHKKLDLSEDPYAQGFGEDSYDLIILDAGLEVEAGRDYSTVLRHCEKLLRPRGELLVTCNFGNDSDAFSLEHHIHSHSPKSDTKMENGRESHSSLLGELSRSATFDLTDVNILSPPNQSRFVVARRKSDERHPTDKVLMIMPHAPSRRVDDLMSEVGDRLRAGGYNVARARLDDVPEDCSPYLCLAALEIDEPFLEKLDERSASKLRSVFLHSSATLWLMLSHDVDVDGSEEDVRGLAHGLGRTIRAEHPEVCFATLSLDSSSALLKTESNVNAISHLTNKILARKQDSDNAAADYEYVVRDDTVFVERLLPHQTLKTLLDSTRFGHRLPAIHGLLGQVDDDDADECLQLSIRDVGKLDTLEFVHLASSSPSYSLADDRMEVIVHAVGLNSHDVAVAMGQTTADNARLPQLGVECSGVVSHVGKHVQKFNVGDRVFGMHPGCFGTRVRDADPRTFQETPSHMSHEQAASVMCAYATACHSLLDVAKLSSGESLLIHSAAGGVGLAAIQVARSVGAGDIFATVSSAEKKQFLMHEYGIAESHIFNSRDRAHSFADGVLRMTGRVGADVVLNLSTTGEALRRSWLCVAPFGRFVELANTDVLVNSGLEMRPFLRNVSFAGVDMLAHVTSYPERFERIGDLVGDLLRKGTIAPPRRVSLYSFEEAEKAFRFLHSGSHIGKIVLRPSPDDRVPIVLPGLSSTQIDQDATYILVGGLGGIVCDVSEKSQLSKVVEDVKQRFPPIKGVIHCAMDLKDAIYENMTIDDWNASLRPKVQATRNLHQLLPRDMDFFICLSSVAGIIGSRGQANYNAGNTYQDVLMRHRAASGLRATSINLGLVLGIGVSTERQEVFQLLKGGGLLGMDETDVLNVVKAAISGRAPEQVVMGLSTGGRLQKMEAADPYWFRDARFAAVRQLDRQRFGASEADGRRNWKSIFAAAASEDEVYDILLAGVLEGISSLLKLNSEDMDPRKSLPHYGIDSLMGIEVRTWLMQEFQADLSVFDIVSNDSLSAFVRKVMARSAFVSPVGSP